MAVYPKGLLQSSGLVTPGQQDNSLIIFSDNEVENDDGFNPDMDNLSPPNHHASKLNLRVPKDEMTFTRGDKIVSI